MSLVMDRAQLARTGSFTTDAKVSPKSRTRALKANLTAAHGKRSTILGVARFLFLTVAYVSCFLITAALPSLSLQLIGSCLLFLIIFHLALMGHDAGHGSPTSSATLNRWIGRLAFLPSYVPLSSWLASHNALHHAYTNLRTKDPVWAPLSKQEYDALSPWQKVRQRFYRTLPGVAVYNVLMGWKSYLFPNSSTLAHIPRRSVFVLERLAALGLPLLQIILVLIWQQFLQRVLEIPTGLARGVFAAIVAPFLLLNWWTGLLSFLHHTHPQVRWYDRLQDWRKSQANVECTVHLLAPGAIDWLFGNSLEHTAHHFAPKATDSQLSLVQQQLEAEMPEVIQKVRLADCLRILGFCKLYDYEQHRWLDYTGEPMSPSLVTPSANTSPASDESNTRPFPASR